MARNVGTIYTAIGQLIAQTPIHVGGIDAGNPDSDMPLAMDGQGRYYIPGTSLAGALRQWTEANLGADATRLLWGFQQGDKGDASLFEIEDSVITATALPEVRDGVGIDKKTGAAQRGIKYDTTILPRGTEMEFQCSVSVVQDSERTNTEGAFRLLLEALQSGRIRIGAQRTRGMGKIVLIVLESAPIEVASLGTRQGIVDHLQGRDKHATIESLSSPQGGGGDRIEVAIHWHPTEPVMVKSGVDGIAIDGLPLVSGVDCDHVALVIPGSSIKGVLSSQAGLIVKTVTGQKSDGEPSKATVVLERLFGIARTKAGSDNVAEGMGMLAVDDCYAKDVFERDTWQRFTTALDEKQARKVLAEAHLTEKMRAACHVAIDRWTGGASNQKLFSQMEPQGIDWEPISLSLDFSRLKDSITHEEMVDAQKEIMALLLLVLRDMATGRLPLGFGTNRGMGSVAVDRIVLTPSGISWMKEDADLKSGDIAALPDGLIKDVQQAWQRIMAVEGGA
jgi:CRISPR/Cas system CSM-associated protein Csm3 (group 7 of RAMP superfamily)